jgi:hypothetical protein
LSGVSRFWTLKRILRRKGVILNVPEKADIGLFAKVVTNPKTTEIGN